MKLVNINGIQIETNNPIVGRARMHGSGTIVKEYETLKATKARCSGCYDDFYNYGDNSTSGECWALKSARVVDKVGYSWIGRDYGPDTIMKSTLSCWHAVEKCPPPDLRPNGA